MPVLKFLFEFVTEQFSLFENILYNYIAMVAVGFIAFSIAFRMVGTLYRLDIIDGKFIGSLLHWIIRLIVFVVLIMFVSIVILFIKIIIAFQTWMWFALLAIGVIGMIAYIARKKYMNNYQK